MRNIWAVALNTIRQAIRIKIVLAFMVMLFVLIPVMALGLSGDGTVKGRLQSFITYSLSLTSLILSLMTIILTTFSLSDDIKQKRIFMVLTKPIRRTQFLLGKLGGVLLLDIFILIFCTGLIYFISIYIPRYYEVSQQQMDILNDEFYSARISIRPPIPDVTEEVKELYKQLSDSRQLPQNMSTQSIMRELRNRKLLEKNAAAPGQALEWEFTNVRVHEPNQNLFIKFKYDVAVNPPDNLIHGLWDIGDLRQVDFGVRINTPIYRFQRQDIIRTSREFAVPSGAVASDGYLRVVFVNAPFNPTTVIFPYEEGLEVLYKADTYTANFIRGVFLIMFRLIFLACLGILASSFLSFPVAILLCISVFVMAVSRDFILSSFSYFETEVSIIYSLTVQMFVKLIPQFDQLNPADFLVGANLISWSMIAEILAFVVFFKSGLILILALIIFSYREIAKIVV